MFPAHTGIGKAARKWDCIHALLIGECDGYRNLSCHHTSSLLGRFNSTWRFKCIDFPDIFKNNVRNLNTTGRGTLHRNTLLCLLFLRCILTLIRFLTYVFPFLCQIKSNEMESLSFKASCAVRNGYSHLNPDETQSQWRQPRHRLRLFV